MLPFEALEVPLAGQTLIEASAGTGKTYAIASLYVRLLVEQGLSPEEILVVTFTEAATKELRGRIRGRIGEAFSVLSGTPTSDPFLAGIRDNANGRGPGLDTARRRLDAALRRFDLAAILTIHSFCLRALQDNAFESGAPYDTELVTDQVPLLQEVVDDFWRTRFFSGPALLLGAVLGRGDSPGTFRAFAGAALTGPKGEIIPRFTPAEIAGLEDDCRATHAALRDLWRREGGLLTDILLHHKGLSRSEKNYREDVVRPLLAAMEVFAAGDNPYDLFPGFALFTASRITREPLKKFPPPEHPFFDLCETLMKEVERRYTALKCELTGHVAHALPARKEQLNIRFYDDLLEGLWRGLSGQGGTELAERLRGCYRAALVDEFQDTDPVQYDIFRMIYAGSGAPLFLIGDPKQAIYTFRGADIYAYLEAASGIPAGSRYTLTTNWRSAPRLLDAFNLVFSGVANPFACGAIPYESVAAPPPGSERQGEGIPASVAVDGAPLRLWFAPRGDAKLITVQAAMEIIPATVAAEIARLLAGDDSPERRGITDAGSLHPGSIAVIVRGHRQAAFMQKALGCFGIPSVLQGTESIFATREAREVQLLLAAVTDPGNETRVRSALTTTILGRTGDDLVRLHEREEEWEQVLERFREYHRTWLDQGVMVMSRRLMSEEQVRGRLLGREDGERRLTNLHHCFELLHEAALERRCGPEGLLTWFGELVAAPLEREEHLLRLETDEKAVRIVTIHASKGLEYPVVFCPFSWGGVVDPGQVISFHDGYRLVKDLGSDLYQEHLATARKEIFAENLRLLYVALTRAKYRCYLVWGKFRHAESSAPAWLFHAAARSGGTDDVVAATAAVLNRMSDHELREDLARLAEAGGGTIAVTDLPGCDAPAYALPATDGEVIACRSFEGRIDDEWRVASFSSLVSGRHGAEHPDRDETASRPPRWGTTTDAAGPAQFPGGTRAGIFLHDLFERLDFRKSDDLTVDQLVIDGLRRWGYDAAWREPVSRMIRNTLSLDLGEGGMSFTLTDLAEGSWVKELEFFFPLRLLKAGAFAECYRRWSGLETPVDLGEVLGALRIVPVKGMVRGFMDLVFRHGGKYYLVDWKSNFLGTGPEEYRRERLAAEMARRCYSLQYLLYTVALHRFLTLRDPGYDYERGFGGIRYLFLRGIDPVRGAEYGLFSDLPPRQVIDDLTELLVEQVPDSGSPAPLPAGRRHAALS